MNKSITQATQNDKQISKSIKGFFTRFHISSALKAVYGKGNPMITGHLGLSLIHISAPIPWAMDIQIGAIRAVVAVFDIKFVMI